MLAAWQIRIEAAEAAEQWELVTQLDEEIDEVCYWLP